MFSVTNDGAVARLTLDRPAARNAITKADWIALGAVLEQVAAARPRALLIVSSRPDAFCAGADLAEVAGLVAAPGERPAFRQALRTGLDGLAALPFPTVAAIDGGCFGAGVALALACDIRIAGAGARFALPPAKLGISYPREDLRRLVALIGTGQASRLLFGALTIDAVEAARIGLAEQVVPRAAQAAEALVADIAAMSPFAIRALKRGMKGESGDAANRAFDAAFGAPDLAVALEARRAGRPPVFK